MQPVDYTTLMAACSELQQDWVPARVEQVYQRDRYTISIALRTLEQRRWLTICWHPQAARICIGDAPPRIRDTFTFSDQLRHQLGGFALTKIATIAPWERVVNLEFAKRPTEEPLWHLYVEIIGKYSNVILTDAKNLIVTTAHQVSNKQSSVRTVQTGQPYETPPALTGTTPSLQENQTRWQERVNLIPGAIARQLLKSYRGLSPAVARSLVQAANLDPEQANTTLNDSDWENLWQRWQQWLISLAQLKFQPGWTTTGYTVLGWNITQATPDTQTLLNRYYTEQIYQQKFQQLRHQLSQKVTNLLAKLRHKAKQFQQRLHQADNADQDRQQADLLMAHLQDWQPGMDSITIADFVTGKPTKITLNPEKNAVQNAQILYKRHQKLKRTRAAVEPLMQASQAEIDYLEQVEASLAAMENYRNWEDLQTLEEIREELIEQNYLTPQLHTRSTNQEAKPHCYRTPSGFEVLIGRNNRQNEQLTFRSAVAYDLWFHTQEIAGSHVLLRLDPGAVAQEEDLQFTADLAAYYSRARHSDVVPVVYTKPKYVYKPKGAKPGMAIYKQEQVIWGRPHRAVSRPNLAK